MVQNATRYLLVACIIIAFGIGLTLAFQTVNNKMLLQAESQHEHDTYNESGVYAVSVAEIDYFTEARMEKMRSRSYTIESLKDISESANFHDSVRVDAQKALVSLIKRGEYEYQIEELVRGRGFADCLALIHDDGVTVVVRTSMPTPNDIAKVADIVHRVSGVSREKIVITEY